MMLWHQCADILRVFGLRDRLRCPHCGAVGTWKPHGGWLDFSDKRRVRRWLCKWCGWYEGPEGRGALCEPNLNKGCWDFKGDTAPTPKAIVESQLKTIWPWRG